MLDKLRNDGWKRREKLQPLKTFLGIALRGPYTRRRVIHEGRGCSFVTKCAIQNEIASSARVEGQEREQKLALNAIDRYIPLRTCILHLGKSLATLPLLDCDSAPSGLCFASEQHWVFDAYTKHRSLYRKRLLSWRRSRTLWTTQTDRSVPFLWREL